MFDESVWAESDQGLMMLMPKPPKEEEAELEDSHPVMHRPGQLPHGNHRAPEPQRPASDDALSPNDEAPQLSTVGERRSIFGNENEKPSVREELIAKYGSPDEPHKITPQKDSPEPYKAFTEALAAGDEELAYGYARKFVRYQRELQELQGKMVEIQGKAMLREGMLAPDSWAMANEYDETAGLLANDLENANKSYELELPEQAKAMLEQAREQERLADQQKDAFLKAHLNLGDADYDREQAKAKYAGKLRRSPTDTVELMLFVRMDDYRSEVMAKNLQQLFLANQENQTLKFTGLSIENVSGSSVSAFMRKTGVGFKVQNGAALAKQLGITESPSLVIISSGTDTVSVEAGVRSLAFLEEMVK